MSKTLTADADKTPSIFEYWSEGIFQQISKRFHHILCKQIEEYVALNNIMG